MNSQNIPMGSARNQVEEEDVESTVESERNTTRVGGKCFCSQKKKKKVNLPISFIYSSHPILIPSKQLTPFVFLGFPLFLFSFFFLHYDTTVHTHPLFPLFSPRERAFVRVLHDDDVSRLLLRALYPCACGKRPSDATRTYSTHTKEKTRTPNPGRVLVGRHQKYKYYFFWCLCCVAFLGPDCLTLIDCVGDGRDGMGWDEMERGHRLETDHVPSWAAGSMGKTADTIASLCSATKQRETDSTQFDPHTLCYTRNI